MTADDRYDLFRDGHWRHHIGFGHDSLSVKSAVTMESKAFHAPATLRKYPLRMPQGRLGFPLIAETEVAFRASRLLLERGFNQCDLNEEWKVGAKARAPRPLNTAKALIINRSL